MLIVADVHGAFGALRQAARRGRPLLVLGDLVNLVDYRTKEGIFADVFGEAFVEAMVGHRGRGESICLGRSGETRWPAGRTSIGPRSGV